jgi:phage/plasmid-like protein (TIGR03299 family)
MSAEVETMMYAGAVPWHGLGVKVPGNVSWSDAIVAAGLDWAVEKRRAFINSPLAQPGEKRPVECPFKALTRMSDGRVYAAVSDKYSPIQNRDAFSLFGSIFGEAAVLNTAGALRDGATVWGLAEFPGDFTVGHDKHTRHLLVTTNHDASGSLKAFPCATRVVCANTLAMAMGEGRKRSTGGITVRHTGDMGVKLADAGDTLATIFAAFTSYQSDLESILALTLDKAETQDVLGEIVNLESSRGQNVAAEILMLATSGKGNAPYAGTGYALFQGVTDYVDHYRGSAGNPERRFESAMLTSGAVLKQSALTALLSRVKVTA